MRLSVSGGPFANLSLNQFTLKSGNEERPFKDWGHCGPCGDGAVSFYGIVKRWKAKELNIKYNQKLSSGDVDIYDIDVHDKYVKCSKAYFLRIGEKFSVFDKYGIRYDCKFNGYSVQSSIMQYLD